MGWGRLELDDELARALVKSAADAVVVVDSQGGIVFANAQVEVMFGYSREDLLGQRVETLIPERDPDDLVGRRRDGSEFPIEASVSPVDTSKGTFFAAAFRDVTERRNIERTLRDAEERFRIALDEAPIGMALVGLDRRYLRVNRALSAIPG